MQTKFKSKIIKKSELIRLSDGSCFFVKNSYPNSSKNSLKDFQGFPTLLSSSLAKRLYKKDQLQSFVFQTTVGEKTKAKNRSISQTSRTSRYLRRYKRMI